MKGKEKESNDSRRDQDRKDSKRDLYRGDRELVTSGSGAFSHRGLPQIKPLKLEFRRFDGVNPEVWIYKANQFYSYYQTPNGQKIFLASFHVEGDALTWFQDSEEAGVFTSWEAFTKTLYTRFRLTAYDDPMETMQHLRETGYVLKFNNQFKVLSNKYKE